MKITVRDASLPDGKHNQLAAVNPSPGLVMELQQTPVCGILQVCVDISMNPERNNTHNSDVP